MGGEYRPDKDPLLWRLAEGIILNILFLIAGVVAVVEIISEALKHLWTKK